MVTNAEVFLKVLVDSVNRETALVDERARINRELRELRPLIRQCADLLKEEAPAGGEGVVDEAEFHNPNAIVAEQTNRYKAEVEAAIKKLADGWTAWRREGGAR